MRWSLCVLLSFALWVSQITCNLSRQELLEKYATASQDEFVPTNVQFSPGANKTHLEPQFFPDRNSKRVELKYGPFLVNPMNEYNGMVDYLQIGGEMPCADCFITYMEAGLQYPNGAYANANTSLWLHHVVIINLNNPDTVCGKHYYGHGERWFASGNERTPANLCLSGAIPAGYYIAPGDNNVIVFELMNQGMDYQTAVPTITFEYIEGHPDDFFSIRPIWMDIGGCKTASDMPVKSHTTFEYTSPSYTSDFSGVVTGMGGHLHDGGTHLEIFQNQKEVCNCIAAYGQTPGYWDVPGTSMIIPLTPNFSPMSHVSSISSCYAPTSIISPGDVIDIKAYYNFTEYNAMLNTDGTFSDIMGISMIFLAEGMTKNEMAGFVGTSVAPLAILPAPTSVSLMDVGGMDDKDEATHMGEMSMQCIPLRDSPGLITTDGLNMNNRHVAMTYLMAILDDNCLQAWSKPYVIYFWAVIVGVIGLFTLVNLLLSTKLTLRRRSAAANKSTTADIFASTGFITRSLRLISYPQVSYFGLSSLLRDDAMPLLSKSVAVPALGTTLMIGAFLAVLFVLQFVNVSTGDNQTWQFMGVRAGWLSVGQVPLIILLAGKRNMIGLLTRVSYERLNVLHRWVARGLLLTATFHLAFQNYGWARAGVLTLEWSTDNCPPTGIAAYAILLWINISSLAPFRNMFYEFFVIQHIICFMGLIIAIMLHLPSTALGSRTYIYIAIGLYVLSRVVQTMLYVYRNIKPGRATVTRVSDNIMKISLRNERLQSWNPGSFVLLSIPRYGILQSHPFTITSTPSSDHGNLNFLLSKRKGFTSRLECDSDEAIALIDGPYGGKQCDLAAFQTLVLIAGSTGISFMLPILQDIESRASKERLPVQELQLVWSTKDRDFALHLRKLLAATMSKLRDFGINVTSNIHITGLPAFEAEKSETSSTSAQGTADFDPIQKEENTSCSEEVFSDNEKKQEVQTRITQVRTLSNCSSHSSIEETNSNLPIISRRANLRSVLEISQSKTTGEMAVAVCGPLEMSSEVRNIVAGMNISRTANPQGVYLHVEGFGW